MNNFQDDELILISHILCPYVQRTVTILEELGLSYKRIDIDLNNKPAWFNKISPLGKVPVLVVNDDVVLFESAIINEYINETKGGLLLADEPLKKAQQRAWVEFASASLNNIARIYNAGDEFKFTQEKKSLAFKFSHLEENLTESSYFSNEKLSIVDAAFAPVFRYLDLFENLDDFKFMESYPKVKKWRHLLSENISIKKSASKQYPQLLYQFISARESFLGERARNFQLNNIEQAIVLAAD